jgi:hypothetical protein
MSNEGSTTTQVTTNQVVATVVSKLRDDVQIDTELLDILSEHIVKMAPAETAITDAINAIEALAEKRAEEPDNGPANHD